MNPTAFAGFESVATVETVELDALPLEFAGLENDPEIGRGFVEETP